MRRVVVLLALASLTLTGAEGGCEGGTSRGAQQPAPVPDPSALASVGQDRHSILLHVDWEGYREFHIKWHSSQDGQIHELYQKPNKVGSRWGGFFEITVVVDPAQHVGVSIAAGPRLSKTEVDGRAHCWIRHNGAIVDEDRRGSGPVLCVATNVR